MVSAMAARFYIYFLSYTCNLTEQSSNYFDLFILLISLSFYFRDYLVLSSLLPYSYFIFSKRLPIFYIVFFQYQNFIFYWTVLRSIFSKTQKLLTQMYFGSESCYQYYPKPSLLSLTVSKASGFPESLNVKTKAKLLTISFPKRSMMF